MNQKLIFALMTLGFIYLPQADGSEQPIDLSISLVKIRSFKCVRTGRELRGSGILFQQNDVQYVLTSEHVLYHGNDDFCHQASNSALGSLKAVYVAADYAYGIGLLKLEKQISDPKQLIKIPSLNLFSNSLPHELDSVVFAGFNSASDIPLIRNLGTILNIHSKRHWIPLISEGIEVANTYGESGMSGGVYLSQSRDQIIGLISHLFYQLIPGEEKEIKEYGDSRPTENHVFVIPSPVLISWVKGVLSLQGEFKPTVGTHSISRTKGTEKILLDGLAFEMKPSLLNTPAIAYGGDGVGIGGCAGGARSQRVEVNKVKVTLDESRQSEPLAFPSKSNMLRDLKLKLFQQGGVLEIELFVTDEQTLTRESSDGVTHGHQLISFRGLAEFLHYLLSPEYSPVLVSDAANNSQHAKILYEKAKQFSLLSEKLSGILDQINEDSVGFQETRNLCKEIHQICTLLQSEQFQRVTRTDLKRF